MRRDPDCGYELKYPPPLVPSILHRLLRGHRAALHGLCCAVKGRPVRGRRPAVNDLSANVASEPALARHLSPLQALVAEPPTRVEVWAEAFGRGPTLRALLAAVARATRR